MSEVRIYNGTLIGQDTPETGSSSVVGFSGPAVDLRERAGNKWQAFLNLHGLTTEEIGKVPGSCSWLNISVRPPLTGEAIHDLASLCINHGGIGFPNNGSGWLLDCTTYDPSTQECTATVIDAW